MALKPEPPPGLKPHSKEWMRYIHTLHKPTKEKYGWGFRAAIYTRDEMGNPKHCLFETSSSQMKQYPRASTRPSAARRITNLVLMEARKEMKLGNLSRTRFRINAPDRVFVLHLWLVDGPKKV